MYASKEFNNRTDLCKRAYLKFCGGHQLFFYKNGVSNLYKMGRHNPCTTKNSLYKMALGQMDPSENYNLYKMVRARGISQTHKITKKLGL